MKVLQFKCKLLSDVILNQKAATEGPNRTLDFIPGSNFLGIAAGQLYDTLDLDTARKMFHSDRVRFGDAHPACNKHRTLRVPAALYYPKLAKEDERTHWVHHRIANPEDASLRKAQLKQERAGFVDFASVTADGGQAVRLKVATGFAIKSAYDREQRRSKDEQLFGYQAMEEGQEFYFQVEMEDDMAAYEAVLIKALCGVKRVGRSRSAQYGLVEISPCQYTEGGRSVAVGKTKEVVVYADSRLMFLDEDGLPMLQPAICQLLGPDVRKTDGMICWDKSQIGIFRYAPYNYKRGCFDADRYGLEKGSVIVLNMNEPVDVTGFCTRVGSYQNEGFGKVIFNPLFLEADAEGRVNYKIVPDGQSVKTDREGSPIKIETELISYIDKCIRTARMEKPVYGAVNRWVKRNAGKFKGEAFASQWGTIRGIAMTCKNIDELQKKLFEGNKGYLVHGVARDKWNGRRKMLEDFIKENSDNAPMAVVNLASQMQKICKMKNEK